MNKNHKPIRTCIICKNKFEKSKLNGFLYKFKEINSTNNRKFYICDACINQDDMVLRKKMSKFAVCMNLNKETLKERLLNGESSD